VETLAAHGIYSIIDLHAVPGFQNQHCSTSPRTKTATGSSPGMPRLPAACVPSIPSGCCSSTGTGTRPTSRCSPSRCPTRYPLLRDQLGIYRDYQASWALWTYKDIGRQGVVYAAADSPYLTLIKDFLVKKERLGADSWGGTDEYIRDVVEPLDPLLATEFPQFSPYPWGAKKVAARMLRHILISEALLPEFAERFRGITPAEARARGIVPVGVVQQAHRPGTDARTELAKG
jgi:hypothetical protein